MAYSEFNFDSVRQRFGLSTDEQTDLFVQVAVVEPSQILRAALEENIPLGLAIGTEKARSELMIMPVLVEARRLAGRRVSLFSGVEFNVAPEQGLNGFCDFIFSLSPEQYVLRTPALMVVEAKQENIPGGFGQCIAEMVAAQLFNARTGQALESVYGAVTTGNNWRFLKLTGRTIFVDWREYQLAELGKLLGILLHIFQTEQTTQVLAA